MKINIKKLSKKQLIILAVVAVFVIVLIAWGTLSIVKNEDPITAIGELVTDQDALLGNWQGEKAINAYVFYEDGSYESYISTFAIDGKYTVEGSKITLRANGADGYVTYKYKIRGDKLTLTLVDSNGMEPKDEEDHEFTKVDELHLKTLTEALQDFAEEIQQNPDETEASDEGQ